MPYKITDNNAPNPALFKEVAQVATLADAKVWLVEATMKAFGDKPYQVFSEDDIAEDGIDYFAFTPGTSTTLPQTIMFAVDPIKA